MIFDEIIGKQRDAMAELAKSLAQRKPDATIVERQTAALDDRRSALRDLLKTLTVQRDRQAAQMSKRIAALEAELAALDSAVAQQKATLAPAAEALSGSGKDRRASAAAEKAKKS